MDARLWSRSPCLPLAEGEVAVDQGGISQNSMFERVVSGWLAGWPFVLNFLHDALHARSGHWRNVPTAFFARTQIRNNVRKKPGAGVLCCLYRHWPELRYCVRGVRKISSYARRLCFRHLCRAGSGRTRRCSRSSMPWSALACLWLLHSPHARPLGQRQRGGRRAHVGSTSRARLGSRTQQSTAGQARARYWRCCVVFCGLQRPISRVDASMADVLDGLETRLAPGTAIRSGRFAIVVVSFRFAGGAG